MKKLLCSLLIFCSVSLIAREKSISNVIDFKSITSEINSTDAEILSFLFSESYCGCELGTSIDPFLGRILVRVPYHLDLSSLAPSTIGISPGATIFPLPSTSQNWTLGPIEYTVTASDGITTKTWSVKVESSPCHGADFTFWSININVDYGYSISNVTNTLDVIVRAGTDLSSLIPSIGLSCGATITTLAGDPFPATVDFSVTNPQQFRITAEDGVTSKIWTVLIHVAGSEKPVITMDAQTAPNCNGGSITASSSSAGRIVLVYNDLILFNADSYILQQYWLDDKVNNYVVAYVNVDNPDVPITIPTTNLQDGTYWAYAIDNWRNVSLISTNSITVTRCLIPVNSIAELKQQKRIHDFVLNQEVVITYEESRVPGNIKYAQTADQGLFIDDQNKILPDYGTGAGISGIRCKIYSNLMDDIISVPISGGSPTQTSTGNVVTPIQLTYDQYKSDCYVNTGPGKYESMLVTITTPMIVFDDYSPSHPNWMFDNLDLAAVPVQNAARVYSSPYYNWFIQSIFNSPLIGTAIPVVPAIYTGIRTNVNWGVGKTYGLITPRNAADITLSNSPVISVSPNPPEITGILPGQCKSATVKIFNEGVGNLDITAMYLYPGTPGIEFNLVSPPAVPFTIGTWASRDLIINFCPLEFGPKTVNLVIEYGVSKTLTVLVKGQTAIINTLPSCQDFSHTVPYPLGTLTYYFPTDGWTTNPASNSSLSSIVMANGYFSFSPNFYGGSYDGSNSIYIRNRELIGGMRQTTWLGSPGFLVSGTNPAVTWVEGKCSRANPVGAGDSSPRNIWLSTDGINFTTLLASYLTSSQPEVSSLTGISPNPFLTRAYSLSAFTGQRIWLRWEAVSFNNQYIYWDIDNICVKELITGPVIAAEGHGNFGGAWVPAVKQNEIKLTNSGLSLLRIKSMEIIGDPVFSVTSGYGYPVDIEGAGAAWSDITSIPMLDLTVQFNPLDAVAYSGILRIKYGTDVEKVLDIPLTGRGITCASVVTLEPPEASVNIVTNQDALFKYTAAYDQTITVTSCLENNKLNSPSEYSYDTYIMIYSDCPLTPDKLLGSNDDMMDACAYNRASSTCTLSLAANQTVYIWWPLVFPTALHAFDPFVFSLSVTPPPPWPDAQFEASETIITAGSSIDFTSLSSGNPTSWLWDFTTGATPSTSTAANPTGVTYPAAGIYQVSLKAANAFLTGNRTKEFYIVVGDQPLVPAISESFTVTGLKAGGSVGSRGWTFVDNTNSGMNWQVRKTGVGGCFTDEGPMASTTGSSGYLVLPADEYKCLGGVPSGTKVDAYAQSPSFDCSGFDAVIIEFQQRFRVCCDLPQMELMVSIDGGLNWKRYDLLQGRANSETWGDPVETVKLNISEIASRQSDVKVRFYWKGSTEYFWMIDDVKVEGITACDGFTVSVGGTSKVYYGYSPMSRSTLTASVSGGVPPYSYAWSTGEATPSIKVAPVTGTEYSVDVIDVQGCMTSARFMVQVEDVRCGTNLEKVAMCTKGSGAKSPPTSVCVAASAVPAQLKTGATLGTCKKSGMAGDELIVEQMDPELIVYPNPTNGRVNLELNGLGEGTVFIEIHDVLGRTVIREEISNPDNHYLKSIDLDKAGIYLITIKNSSVTMTRQVSVIR